MKIGIDAKWYFSGPPSGTVVVKNIIDCIIKQNNGDEIILFIQKKDRN